jgi:predicted NAD/FAD-dependent oxidoreductase
MISSRANFSCLIIGAGMAGLMAARSLQEAGSEVVVLEQETTVGGRMAARPIDTRQNTDRESVAIFDHGAQYFTTRDPRFERLAARWLKLGIIREWSKGFATGDGSFYADGLARFYGIPDMSALPQYLARDLDVRINSCVRRVARHNGAWRTTTVNDGVFTSDFLIMTPPVPQSLALLDASQVIIPERQREALTRIDYEPCLAVLVQLDGPGKLPEPGGMWNVGEPISWIADNYRKGISPVPGAFTIHAGPEYSHDRWRSPDDTIIHELTIAAGQWFGSNVSKARVYRWPYSKPFWIYPDECLYIDSPGPIVFAGDAFAGPRVEGAALSGLAAGQALL